MPSDESETPREDEGERGDEETPEDQTQTELPRDPETGKFLPKDERPSDEGTDEEVPSMDEDTDEVTEEAEPSMDETTEEEMEEAELTPDETTEEEKQLSNELTEEEVRPAGEATAEAGPPSDTDGDTSTHRRGTNSGPGTVHLEPPGYRGPVFRTNPVGYPRSSTVYLPALPWLRLPVRPPDYPTVSLPD